MIIYNNAGPPGMKGERGEMGDTGSKGEQGDKGEKGCEGPMGPAGNTGARGPVGPAGPAGLSGLRGKCINFALLKNYVIFVCLCCRFNRTNCTNRYAYKHFLKVNSMVIKLYYKSVQKNSMQASLIQGYS